jgi:L-alanine-DL-glutamate epimerase-like enolase superfamily enzyme
MARDTDIRPVGTDLHLLSVETRVPLKFGTETLTEVTCARVRMTVADAGGERADGWGETPLSVQWVWPSELSYADRHEALVAFCRRLAEAWAGFGVRGHALEVGHAFLAGPLAEMLDGLNAERADRGEEPMPYLAALVCCSAFDIALHDAFGRLRGLETYGTYTNSYMSRDLSAYLTPARDADVDFTGLYPADFLVFPRPDALPAWHLVGGKDLLDDAERTGDEPDDGYPVVLTDWIARDGLTCLKVKLRGNDAEWDYDRLVRVGEIARAGGAEHLSADFNCTVREPAYVNDILDKLKADRRDVWDRILYVEQPFPYALEQNPIDVHSLAGRKPLFMDESAHDWRLVRLGRELGWTGVALKTCKTQTGALLSLCWAKAHGMSLMVQDLTNPMLAQVPHVLLAAHAGTIMGVETNAMQFYPEASSAEAEVHPGLYTRADGMVRLDTLHGPGFGYRTDEIDRTLPEPVVSF